MNPIALTPARLYGTAIALLVVALAFAGLYAWGMSWKADAAKFEAERDSARAQVVILADSVKVCSAGVDAVKKASDAAISFGASALAEAQKRNAPIVAQIARLEELMRKPPPNATCDDAWRALEQNATPGSQR